MLPLYAARIERLVLSNCLPLERHFNNEALANLDRQTRRARPGDRRQPEAVEDFLSGGDWKMSPIKRWRNDKPFRARTSLPHQSLP